VLENDAVSFNFIWWEVRGLFAISNDYFCCGFAGFPALFDGTLK
jgi:hypothetical protein